MALISRLGQQVGERRHGAVGRVGRDAQLAGDLVGGLEADAAHVARQPVRGLADHPHGVVAVLAVDVEAERGRDIVLGQEEHDLLDGLLLLPGSADGAGAHGADAGGLLQTLRGVLDDLERLGAEVGYQPLGRHLAHAADEPRAEVLTDTFDAGGQHHGTVVCLELAPVAGVRRPAPAQAHVLSNM